MSVCKSWLKYDWKGGHCENPPWEDDPEGLCILHSLMPEKNQYLFEQALKAKLADNDFDFRGVFFPGPISFAQQAFNKTATFENAHFNAWADFHESEFSAAVDFSQAVFSQAANFAKTHFGGPVKFNQTKILGGADFRAASFADEVFFQRINASQPPFSAFFQNIQFEARGRLQFQDLSLEQVSFLGTDMRLVTLHNVRWPTFHGRLIVADELRLHHKSRSSWQFSSSQPDYDLKYEDICARIEKLYRYLKLNYEHEVDYKQAGDFHFGEMEMHRRANPWRRWFPFSWYNLYQVLSGYGERPLRAFGWLVAFVMGAAFLLEHLGLKTHEGSWAGFEEAVVYVLEVSTLLRPEWPKPVTPVSHFVSALAHFLIPGQAALFLLAIRNRLGRRH